MELSYIREFLVMADVLNYKKASESLYVSQSTLFNHIRALEDELGFELFTRNGRGIRLSEYGELFLPYAKIITDSIDSFRREAEEQKLAGSHQIRIGSQYRITELIHQFKETHGEYIVYDMDTSSAESALYDNEYDLAFIRDLKDPENRYESIPYVTDTLAVAVSPGHPLASRQSVKVSELKNENFISCSRHENEGPEVEHCCRAGFFPHICATAANGTEAAHLVSDGVGIAFLARDSILSFDDVDVVLLDLEPEVKIEVSLCWRRDRTLSEGARLFVEFVKGLSSDTAL